jgi:15-cis-phytoene synthase
MTRADARQRTRQQPAITGLALYDATSVRCSAEVIRAYSSSFGLASRLLAAPLRPRIAAIYALVRIADEIVDGAAAAAGLDAARQRSMLDELERDTVEAMRTGYSSNPVVHAFAFTAREAQFGPELTAPFFASMRRDLDPIDFTPDEFERYVYGSAEVVGLMCLHCFLIGVPTDPAELATLVGGARRLGAAFQKVNFLRDLAEDYRELGRRYFPGVDPERLDERTKIALLDDIDADLAAADATVPLLPASCRRAVASAAALFGALSGELRRTPAAEVVSRRVRVSDAQKARVVARAVLRNTSRPGSRR